MDAGLLVLEPQGPLGPSDIEVLGASPTEPLMIFRVEGSMFGMPTIRPVHNDYSGNFNFSVSVDGRTVWFYWNGWQYLLLGDNQAVGDITAASHLTFATDSAGVLRIVPGRPSALHAVVDGRCSKPFSVESSGESVAIVPADACTDRLTVAPLATVRYSSADKAAARSNAYTFAGSDLFEPTRLATARATTRWIRGGVGESYRARAADYSGAAPHGMGRSVARAIEQLPAIADVHGDDDRPLFVFHVPRRLRALVDTHGMGTPPLTIPPSTGTSTESSPAEYQPAIEGYLVFDQPDRFELPPDDCARETFDPQLPRNATVVIDPYGVAHTFYYDERGEALRTVNGETGSVADTQTNGLGNIIGQRDPEGGRLCAFYDDESNVLQTTAYSTPGGLGGTSVRIQRYAYQYAPTRVVSVTDPRDSATMRSVSTYDGKGNLSTTTDATGETTTYHVNARGAVERVVYPAGNETRLVWDDDSGRLGSVIRDAAGDLKQETRTIYDRAGRPINSYSASGAIQGFTWAEGRLISTAWGDGSTGTSVSYEYDETGKLIRVDRGTQTATIDYALNGAPRRLFTEGWAGSTGVTCSQYGPDGRLIEVVNADGTRVRYEHDGEGRVVRTRQGALGYASGAWDDDCPQVSAALEYGDGQYVVGELEYDAAGRVTKSRDSAGSEVAYAYDGFGREAIAMNELGETTRSGYDIEGRIAWEASYDADGLAVGYRSPQLGDPGLLSGASYSYDVMGRLRTVRRLHFDDDGPIGDGESVTTFAYDANPRRVTVTGDDGGTTTTTYDVLGRPTLQQLPSGDETHWTYQDDGRRVVLTADAPTPSGTITTVLDRSPLGLPLRRAQRLDDGTEIEQRAWQYTNIGDVSTVTSSDGGFVGYNYDDLGRRTGLYRDYGAGKYEIVSFDLDEMGRIVTRTSSGPGDQVTDAVYDLLGRPVSTSRAPSLFETARFVGATMRPDHETDAAGNTFVYQYGPTGRLESVTADGLVRTFGYDGSGRVVSAFTNGSDAGSAEDDYTTEYRYDSFGNLVYDSTGGLTATHEFDGANELVRAQYGTSAFIRTPDALGRTASLHREGAGLIAEYTYAGLGGPVSIERGNGVTTTFNYGQLGRRVGMHDVLGADVVASQRWEMPWTDGVPRLHGATFGTAAEVASVYSAGAAERLLSEAHGLTGLDSVVVANPHDSTAANASVSPYLETGSEWATYAIDGRHNWTSVATPAGTRDASLGENDELLALGALSLEYDERGYAVAIGEQSMAYDLFGQLVRIGPAEDPVATFTYDAAGRLASRTDEATGAREDFGYIGAQRVMRLADGATVPQAFVVGSGLDDYLARVDPGGEVSYFHTDRVGSPYMVTDEAGAIAERYEFTAYGERTILSATGVERVSSAVDNALGFQGHWHDPTGIVHMRARAYRPDLGRFLSPDPTGLGGGPNRYTFVGAAPLTHTDPFGLKELDVNPGAALRVTGGLGGMFHALGQMMEAAPVEAGGEIVPFMASLRCGGGRYDCLGALAEDVDLTAFEKRLRASGQTYRVIADANTQTIIGTITTRWEGSGGGTYFDHNSRNGPVNHSTKSGEAALGDTLQLDDLYDIATLGVTVVIKEGGEWVLKKAAKSWADDAVEVSSRQIAKVLAERSVKEAWNTGGPLSVKGIVKAETMRRMAAAAAKKQAAYAAKAATAVKRIHVPNKPNWTQQLQHAKDAMKGESSAVYTVDRAGRSPRRRQNMKGVPTKPKNDRDEWPPAVFAESSAASVRHIDCHSNRSFGCWLGKQLGGKNKVEDGQTIELIFDW